MIDWVTAVIPCEHIPVPRGKVLKVSHEGEVERQFDTTRRFNGSYESSIAMCSNDVTMDRSLAKELFIDGNPLKFLQGHNIIGIDNLNELVLEMVWKLFETIEQPVPIATIRAIKEGNYELKRIDITYYYDVENYYNVNQFIDGIAKKTRTRSGRSTKTKGTAYVNKHSKYWAFKFYSKFDEINTGGKGHEIPKEFYNTPLIEFCREKVRAELVLRRRQLVRIAQEKEQYTDKCLAKHIQGEINDIFNEYVRKIDMSAQMNLVSEKELELPKHLQGPYLLWRQGHDMQQVLKRATFYRVKKQLKDFDIDISLPPVNIDDVTHNVIPLLNIIEAHQAEIPNNIIPFIYNARKSA